MEISKDTLVRIARTTQCEWTKGYIACLLDAEAPTRNEIARELIETAGPNNKIEAIKQIRANFGLGFKEAKDVVDTYYATGNIVGLPDSDEPPMAAGVRV